MDKLLTVKVFNLCETVDVLKTNQRTYATTILRSDFDTVHQRVYSQCT
jgi:hypothetical protein